MTKQEIENTVNINNVINSLDGITTTNKNDGTIFISGVLNNESLGIDVDKVAPLNDLSIFNPSNNSILFSKI